MVLSSPLWGMWVIAIIAVTVALYRALTGGTTGWESYVLAVPLTWMDFAIPRRWRRFKQRRKQIGDANELEYLEELAQEHETESAIIAND